MNIIEGHLVGSELKMGIVFSRWNEFMGKAMLDGALDCLKRHGVQNITVVKVPGSFEIPLAAKKLGERKDIDGVICLGVLIRGGTLHFELIAGQVTSQISALNQELNKPVTFGVITTDTIEQAIERSGSKAGNKGEEAALAAIEMVNLLNAMDS